MNMLFPKILGICEGAAFQEKEIKGEKQLCVRKKDKTSMPIVLKTMELHFNVFLYIYIIYMYICIHAFTCVYPNVHIY